MIFKRKDKKVIFNLLKRILLYPLFIASIIFIITWTGVILTEEDNAFCDNSWRKLETGLELGIFPCITQSSQEGCEIVILRIDTERFELRLLNMSASEQGSLLTAQQWCKKNYLIAAINASMYQQDYKTSVSFMKTKRHVNNPRLSKDRTILAFERLNQKVPKVQIIDRQCQNFQKLSKNYSTFVQSIRMVSCTGKNVWRQQEKKFSTAAIGMDKMGNVLFIHVRYPLTTFDVINILLELPISLKNAMYVEGGSEAQLFVQSGGYEFEFMGKYEPFFIDPGSTILPRPIPNVIGVVRTSKEN